MTQTDALSRLAQQLGYAFRDTGLLRQALTHRSAGGANNERLEFLGDGVLNFVIASELFNRYPDMNEGDLSRLRASLVNKDSLAMIAHDLGLGDFIVLGAGEMKSGGKRRASINADAVESILGAVFCDSDFDTCRSLILRLYRSKLDNLPDVQSLKDAKTQLQEILQSRRIPLPVYNVLNVSGKSHDQEFEVECRVDMLQCTTRAKGRSRRKAEQLAAKSAIDIVSERLANA